MQEKDHGLPIIGGTKALAYMQLMSCGIPSSKARGCHSEHFTNSETRYGWGVGQCGSVISGELPVVVQSLSRVQLFATPWMAACQASLTFTISQEFALTHVH